MTRQQRRYEERKQEKEKQRKPIEELVFNRYKGFIPSKGDFWNVRIDGKLHPKWREKHRSVIADVNINDIEKMIKEDGTLEPWPRYTNDTDVLLYSETIATIVTPTSELKKKYETVTK